MTLPDDGEALVRLDSLIAEIPLADHPYHVSCDVRAVAFELDLGGALDRMWFELQDWYELREGDAVDALAAIRQAASEWPAVKDDPRARAGYFERWRSTVAAAFERPERPPGPDLASIDGVDGRIVTYADEEGCGFVRSDADGATYFFRWEEIKIDAFFKTVAVGARVRFDARIDHAGQRLAVGVVPSG